ncbi:MAG: DUF4397 domain-containing protein [Chitinophaga sp.]|uniref:DUF4397 domain-containing protein n=1 Tax=Chitinophaga sp. TaxID=1869181 RepID=UPI001B0E401C|nr:DUF4397 domain-containing protein [Chitinophaga sp.]MBO9727792.1 DUF4397 domain-containing protein [Chitinophaga sp.]
MKYLIIPIIIGLTLLGACKKNSDSAVPDTHGNFMVVDALPNGVQYDIRLDTIAFASNVGYKTVTGYKSYRAQKYNLIITPAGQPGVILYNNGIFLRNNRYYTAFLGGDSLKNPLLIITEDDLTPARGDSAKFRVIDLSQGFKPNRTPLGMDVLSGVGPIIFKGLAFPSQTAFAPLVGDSAYAIRFKYVDSSLTLRYHPLPTQKGKVYTLVTAGYPLDSARFNILTIQHN